VLARPSTVGTSVNAGKLRQTSRNSASRSSSRLQECKTANSLANPPAQTNTARRQRVQSCHHFLF
jgi:hypothetical protein